MKLYKYELFYWRDGGFTKEELEVIEKPKTYLKEGSRQRLSKSEVGVVDDRWGTPVLFLTEDNDDIARTLFVQHLSARKTEKDERYQRAISEIEKMMALLDNSPVIYC